MLGNKHKVVTACMISLFATIAGAEEGAIGRAFLKTYCVKCHSAKKHNGDVRLDQLALEVTDENYELWEEVLHNIQRGDMPPEDATQPTDAQRRAFLAEVIPNVEAYVADSKASSDPLMRLTNNQIAQSLQDLLQTHEHIADQLIGDPVDKHGFSRQSELDLSGSYLQLYAKGLEQIVERAMPDIEPARPDVFRIAGNDWEKCHWAGDNYLYRGFRRLYEGPKWIGDDFEIPIPPRHEYRMFLRDNRSKGRFRIKLTLRNEPPTYGCGEHFLLQSGTTKAAAVSNQIVLKDLSEPRTAQIPHAGIYQVDVTLKQPTSISVTADSSMPEPPHELTLKFGERDITGTVHQSAFLAIRLPEGPLNVTGRYGDDLAPHRISLTPVPPESQLAIEFRKFEQRESARTPQEIGVYVDQSGAHPYKLVEPITVPVKSGPQHFEVFGAMEDHPGVVSDPIVARDRSPGYWLKFRTLSIVNHNKLEGFKLPARFKWTEPIFLVRPDEQWIKAFGRTPGLIPSANGNNGTHGNEAKGPAVYPEAMKSHGHVVIEKVEFETPFFESWPPRSVQPFLTNGKLKRSEVPVRLKEFAARAWRRPLSKTDAKQIDQIWTAELDAGSNDLEALRSSIVTILCDPRFLYLRHSDNYDLASRLSYFLWNGPPDAQLTDVAAENDHLDDSVIEQQIDRILADQRARRFIEDFVSQWIDFTRFDQIAVDPNYYPAFKDRGLRIKEYMKQECIEFFAHVLHNDVSCLSFLESDFVMVNETLAEHYGIAGVFTPRFVPVAAPDHRGGGVLAQAAVMLAQSNGQDAHAVNRGVWIRSRLLGDPPSDPPPDVPALPEPSSDAKVSGPVSVKQRLDLHLKTGTTCYDCHKDIDPWGIATEGFDAVGLPRTKIQKAGPVVKKVVIDEQEIDGMLPLKQFLLKQRHKQFAYGFTRHMLSYAIGRPLTFRDEQTILALQSEFEHSGYKMRSLIKAIVTSEVYRQGSQSKTEES